MNCSVAPTPQKIVVTASDRPPSASRHSTRLARAKSRSSSTGCTLRRGYRAPLSGTPRFSSAASAYTASKAASETSNALGIPAWRAASTTALPSHQGLTSRPPHTVPIKTAQTTDTSIQPLAATSCRAGTISVINPYLAGA